MPIPKKQCKAHAKATGKQCQLNAMPGGFVCRWHGGMSPNTKRRAAERVAEYQVREIIELREAKPMRSLRDVYEEMMDTASAARLWRQILQERVAELQVLGYAGVTAEQVKADVLLFERALDRSAKITDSIARLNLEERRQVLDEKTGRTIADVIQAVMRDLKLSEEQRRRAPLLVSARLRELETGSVPSPVR